MREDLYLLHERARQGRLDPVVPDHQVHARQAETYRHAAVLALFVKQQAAEQTTVGDDPAGMDIFLVQRSPNLAHHPGQIALPGGGIDPGETPEAAALREAEEETGVRAQCIELIGSIGEVALPVSGNIVTTVLGWSDQVEQTHVWDTAEVLTPLQVSVEELLNPDNRAVVQLATFKSAGFRLHSGWVWGFTGNLLSYLFDQLGWTQPWDQNRTHQMTIAEAHGGRAG